MAGEFPNDSVFYRNSALAHKIVRVQAVIPAKRSMLYLMALLFSLFFSRPDLAVVAIQPPQWQHEAQRTYIAITVENQGRKTSLPVPIVVHDVDISLAAVKEITMDTLVWQLVEENNARAAYRARWDTTNPFITKWDYDMDWEVIDTLPAMRPGDTIVHEVFLPKHWIYDSNCEIEVVIDPDKTQKERERANNRQYFFAWG